MAYRSVPRNNAGWSRIYGPKAPWGLSAPSRSVAKRSSRWLSPSRSPLAHHACAAFLSRAPAVSFCMPPRIPSIWCGDGSKGSVRPAASSSPNSISMSSPNRPCASISSPRPLPSSNPRMVRYHFVGIEGAHRGSVGGGGELMEWARILAYITGTVDQELLLRNEYLAAENRILKAQLQGRLRLSDAERMTLGEIGHRLGRKALSEVATAALPDTILKWYRRLVARKFDGSYVRRAAGRPPIGKEIEELIVRMAKENRSWGYDRIVGALANLGHQVSDQTVGNVLRRHGIPSAPERGRTTTWVAVGTRVASRPPHGSV